MEQFTNEFESHATRNLADEDLSQAVLSTFEHCRSPRLQQVMRSLVSHLHAFVGEVQLTEDEWLQGIDFLTRTGHITDDRRQEFILLSDVLGVSMQVIGINHKTSAGATASTVFGPFFVEGSPAFANGDDLANGAAGEPCFLYGSVQSTAGEPIPRALLEIWQADENGFYDVQQQESPSVYGRGHLHSDQAGKYFFWSVKPAAYPIPGDGPVGELLDAANRSPMRPAHVHFMVSAPGYKTLTTHVFKENDPYLDSDAVFGVKSSLITSFDYHESGEVAPDGRRMSVPFYTMRYDFYLDPTSSEG
jgi:hydroxyquinol 1,2-dioxygenase